jgi:multiple sugar transport system substrate-binding protein
MRAKVLCSSALVAVLALGAAGCSSSGGSAGTTADATSASAVTAALAKGGTLTVWAWEPTLKAVVTNFEKKYPKVRVNLVNAGTGTDQYTALQNVVKAGSGVPDVAQIEYYALPQFVLSKSITDLTSFGAKSLAKTFSAGPWASVQSGSGIYGLPMDSGPMALFYNKTIFTKYHVAVPTTWAQYVVAARELHAANPKLYITNDTGDPGFVTSLIWQAGGTPFKVSGTNVSINLADQGSATFAATWNTLISEKLLAPITSWSDQWYKGLGNDTIATLATGAWLPASLESGVAAGAGQWAVAPLPQWEPGVKASAESGGSSLTIPAASKQKALAYGFLQYANVGAGVQTRLAAGGFPSTTADLQSSAFLNKSVPYFGGQKINKVLAQSASDVVKGWTYLPFQVYANSIFNESVGQAYVGKTTVASGLKAWQDALASYGNQQGFTVTK